MLSRSVMPTSPTPALSPLSWDIFCNVVDNYGDIGVCWRLARQLAHEQGAAVRLWIDDLASFAKLCPSIDRQAKSQDLQGIDIRQWTADFPAVTPQRCVIEAFGCRLPDRFKAAMAAQTPKPVWINLEYLSAESWIEGCHGLPSPDPQLPLVKYFYFPGFVAHSGGLLREAGLLEARRQFRADPAQRTALLASHDLPDDGALLVSLFCYTNPALLGLFAAWAEGEQPVRCLIPEGVASAQLAAFFAQPQTTTGALLQQGALEVRILPFVEQDAYDRLLWAADLCFVRGEDSFVRAQWAAQPFVWHIYPQEEEAHLVKLDAFLERYLSGLPAPTATLLGDFWQAWNSGDAGRCRAAWPALRQHLPQLREHAAAWADEQNQRGDLATNLARFCASQV
jgi:uncharacterized repeat protein (TIGR03837 family)